MKIITTFIINRTIKRLMMIKKQNKTIITIHVGGLPLILLQPTLFLTAIVRKKFS